MARTALVVGLGLMGGSLAAALARAGWRVLLHHRRPEIAQEAAARGWGTPLADLAGARDADCCVVCTPVAAIAPQVRALLAAGARAVTDVGSCKAALARALADCTAAYCGSHPMAGSHLQGLAHADPDLYQGRLALVTPQPATPPALRAVVVELWQAVGCRVRELDPVTHDFAVAEASHLPHLLAAAAAAQLSAAAAPIAASGFRDTTRVAASAASLWSEILLANAEAVGAALDRTLADLTALRAALAAGDAERVTAFLAAGQAGRSRFERSHAEAPPPRR